MAANGEDFVTSACIVL